MSTKGNRTPANSLEYSCALCPYSTNILGSYKRHLQIHSSEMPFKCPECPYRAIRKGHVKQHVKLVHLIQASSFRPFSCPHPGCDYTAKQEGKLTTHAKIHSDEKSFFCSHPDCNFSSHQKGNLVVHTRLHTGEKPFVCQFESCFYATAVSGNLVRHSRKHTKEKPYKCSEANCEYSPTTGSTLKQHQLTHEPKEDEERKLFKCQICEYSGKSKAHLSSHIKSHTLEKLFKCDEPNCNFEAKRNAHLKIHKLGHSDEKPFACPVESCDYCCKYKHDLSQHLRTHSEERRFKCELCPFQGKTRSTVRSHIKSVHADPYFRPFKCTVSNCDSKFKTNSDLKKHLLSHKDDKKYSCSFPDCHFRAVTNCQVIRHENNIHSEEKKVKCRICDYSCKMKSALTIHMRTHRKEEPYKCKEEGCEYRAKQGNLLKRHAQQKHGQL